MNSNVARLFYLNGSPIVDGLFGIRVAERDKQDRNKLAVGLTYGIELVDRILVILRANLKIR